MKYFPRLSLACPFEIVEMCDEVTAVSMGDKAADYHGVILLKNESTRFMFEQLQAGTTLLELIQACMDKYPDSPVDEVGPQVIKFLDMIREKGILVVDKTRGIKVED